MWEMNIMCLDLEKIEDSMENLGQVEEFVGIAKIENVTSKKFSQSLSCRRFLFR